MDKFQGKWKSISVDNFDNFMKEMGVGFVLRKAASMATTYLNYHSDADSVWTIDWEIAFKKGTVSFKLGEETDSVTPDDRKIRMLPTIEDDGSYCEIQRGKPHDLRLVRSIDADGNMQETVTVIGKGVTCTRTYIRY